jgi:hypothetical protein
MSKQRPRRIKGLSMSALRLADRIAKGHHNPKRLRRREGFGFNSKGALE